VTPYRRGTTGRGILRGGRGLPKPRVGVGFRNLWPAAPFRSALAWERFGRRDTLSGHETGSPSPVSSNSPGWNPRGPNVGRTREPAFPILPAFRPGSDRVAGTASRQIRNLRARLGCIAGSTQHHRTQLVDPPKNSDRSSSALDLVAGYRDGSSRGTDRRSQVVELEQVRQLSSGLQTVACAISYWTLDEFEFSKSANDHLPPTIRRRVDGALRDPSDGRGAFFDQ
jgi:hypothetical protein